MLLDNFHKHDDYNCGSDHEDWNDSCSSFSSKDDVESGVHQDLENELYSGASISVIEIILCVASLKLRHNLTDVCISDILKLISKILPQPNSCPQSFYKFKKYFSDLQIPINRHFYCSSCVNLINNNNNKV